jgi:twinkle protein
MAELRSDVIDFKAYLKPAVEEYKVAAPSRLRSEVVDLFYGEGKTEGELLPWPKTHDVFRLRPGEVTLWAGINGHGKTQVTTQVSLHLAEQDEGVMIMSFEMLPKRLLWRACRQAWGGAEPSRPYIDRFLKWADKHIHLLDHQGTVTQELVIGAIRYGAAVLKCQHFVIDSLMKCSKGEDDYNGQKQFVDDLCSVARELRIHVHLVHHVRKGENEFVVPNKFDLKGSGAIVDQADNCCIVWRNKRKELELRKASPSAQVLTEPDCVINVDKQRNGEWEGQIGLWYDAQSMSYLASREAKPHRVELEESVVEIPPAKAALVTPETF